MEMFIDKTMIERLKKIVSAEKDSYIVDKYLKDAIKDMERFLTKKVVYLHSLTQKTIGRRTLYALILEPNGDKIIIWYTKQMEKVFFSQKRANNQYVFPDGPTLF